MKLLIGFTAILFSFAFFNFSCKSSQKALSQQEIQDLPKVLEYARSACFGKCPHFDLSIHENGWMIFDGKRFTKQEGIAIDKLSKEELTQLIADCRAADLWKYQSEYGMNVSDLPTISIHFFEKEKDKKVKWKMRAPTALPTLSNKIMQLVYARDWVENTRKNDKGIALPEGVIENELIVQFKDKIEASQWAQKYERFGLKVKKSLSTLSHIYLLSYDTGKMPPDRMLAMIKKDEEVATAEFNKRMETRSR